MSRILIISHLFPPAPGIGGRRWAKFAKLLSRRGHSVFVLAAENISSEKAEWIEGTNGFSVEYLPYKFPKVVALPVKSRIDKILYRLSVIWLKMTDPGNYYDRSIFWEKQIQDKVEEYINTKSIDTVIATGGPFRLVYYVTKLKRKFKSVKFVSDFRDFWINDTELSALSGMTQKRKEVEKKYEKACLDNSDLIITVSPNMQNYFSGLTAQKPCVVIPNGYDPDDLPDQQKNTFVPTDRSRVRVVFAGTVYKNLDYILIPFFEAIRELRSKRADLYSKFSLDFYGIFPERYKQLIEKNSIQDVVKIHGQLRYSHVTIKTMQAHYCLLLLNNSYNFSFSTKFCEYIAQKKKMLVVSSEGPTSQYVTANDLGWYLDANKPYDALEKAIERVIRSDYKIESNDNFDEKIFSLEKIVLDLESYLTKPE